MDDIDDIMQGIAPQEPKPSSSSKRPKPKRADTKRLYEAVVWQDESNNEPLNVWIVRASTTLEATKLCSDCLPDRKIDVGLIDCSTPMVIDYTHLFMSPRVEGKKSPGNLKIFMQLHDKRSSSSSSKRVKTETLTALSPILVISESVHAAEQLSNIEGLTSPADVDKSVIQIL